MSKRFLLPGLLAALAAVSCMKATTDAVTDASGLAGGQPARVVDLTEPLDAVTGSVVSLVCEPECKLSGLGLDCDGKPFLLMRNGNDMKLVPIAGLSIADVQKTYRYVRHAVDLINAGDFEFLDCGVDEGTGCRLIDAYDRVTV